MDRILHWCCTIMLLFLLIKLYLKVHLVDEDLSELWNRTTHSPRWRPRAYWRKYYGDNLPNNED